MITWCQRAVKRRRSVRAIFNCFCWEVMSNNKNDSLTEGFVQLIGIHLYGTNGTGVCCVVGIRHDSCNQVALIEKIVPRLASLKFLTHPCVASPILGVGDNVQTVLISMTKSWSNIGSQVMGPFNVSALTNLLKSSVLGCCALVAAQIFGSAKDNHLSSLFWKRLAYGILVVHTRRGCEELMSRKA